MDEVKTGVVVGVVVVKNPTLNGTVKVTAVVDTTLTGIVTVVIGITFTELSAPGQIILKLVLKSNKPKEAID